MVLLCGKNVSALFCTHRMIVLAVELFIKVSKTFLPDCTESSCAQMLAELHWQARNFSKRKLV